MACLIVPGYVSSYLGIQIASETIPTYLNSLLVLITGVPQHSDG